MQYKYILSTYIKILKWVNAQFILFFLIYIGYLMHYKIYKYLTSCCLLDSFIDILMPGCPDMFLSIFEESKNDFLGLEQVLNIIGYIFIIYCFINNYNMYKKTNLI